MKIKHHNPAKRFSSTLVSDEDLYFRLCHFCLYLNESTHEIADCERCQRHLTLEPLLRKTLKEEGLRLDGMEEEWNEDEENFSFSSAENSSEEEAQLYQGTTNGLIGLSVFW